MQPDVAALITLQEDDLLLDSLRQRIEGLQPRIRALEAERERAQGELALAEQRARVEERALHDVQARHSEHASLQTRNTAQLDRVRNAREASAAMAQFEVTARILGDEESVLAQRSAEVAASHDAVAQCRQRVASIEDELANANAAIAQERASLETELSAAQEARVVQARPIDRTLLARYEKVRTRKPRALHAIVSHACGACDTTVPLHRRNAMGARGGTDVCEACGVLLYIPE